MRRNQPRPAAAFTLIELLVVISIIALLISILLPALREARETARNAVCLSNQRQLIVAADAYTNDHSGDYPFIGRKNGEGIVSSGPTGDPGSHELRDLGRKNHATRPNGLGYLYAMGYHTAPQGMYCPLAEEGSPSYESNLPSGNGEFMVANPANGSRYNAGYFFNPELLMSPTNPELLHPAYPEPEARFPRSDLMTPDGALTVDWMSSISAYPYEFAHLKGPTDVFWNVGYGDGHVEAERSAKLIRDITPATGNVLGNGNNQARRASAAIYLLRNNIP